MTPLEIISRLCEITEELSGIVKKQQEMIERSKVEEGVKEELRNMVNEADGKLDVLEYHMRRYCDTDDVGAFGKEQPSDDRTLIVVERDFRRICNLFRDFQ